MKERKIKKFLTILTILIILAALLPTLNASFLTKKENRPRETKTGQLKAGDLCVTGFTIKDGKRTFIKEKITEEEFDQIKDDIETQSTQNGDIKNLYQKVKEYHTNGNVEKSEIKNLVSNILSIYPENVKYDIDLNSITNILTKSDTDDDQTSQWWLGFVLSMGWGESRVLSPLKEEAFIGLCLMPISSFYHKGFTGFYRPLFTWNSEAGDHNVLTCGFLGLYLSVGQYGDGMGAAGALYLGASIFTATYDA